MGKQLEQLLKTTSLRRATSAAIQERREVSRRDEESVSLDQIVIYMLQYAP